MTHAEAVVAAARTWIGTPYVHQASCRGGGTDCLGLVRGIWRDLHGQEPCRVPPYTADWGELRTREILWDAASTYLVPLAPGSPAPGQVLLFRMRSGAIAKHLGILAKRDQQPSLIHAFSGHGVVESPFSAAWARRVVARFSFPER